MEEATSKLYPFRRANLAQPCIETQQLIPPTEQERYDIIFSELGAAAIALNELYAAIPDAQSRLQAAYEARDDYFRRLGAYE